MRTLCSCLFLAFLLCPVYAAAQTLEEDSLALVSLYNATGGPDWRETWDLDTTITTWPNVTITNDRVVRLSLRFNNLVGSLPPEMANLTALTRMDLDFNALANPASGVIGSIPNLDNYTASNNSVPFSIAPELGQSTSLEKLYLEDNQITGDVPPAVAMIPTLEILDLSGSGLAGSVPADYSPSLIGLDYQDNGLTVDISNFFANNTGLVSIDLSNNKLTGSIPAGILRNGSLRFLDLSQNELTGSIPANIGTLRGLASLFLSDNALSGELPASLTQLTGLETFQIRGNAFTGELPAVRAFYEEITVFDVSRNAFTGEIPAEMTSTASGTFFNLGTVINLGDNQLTGTMPVGLVNVSKLTALVVSNNQLEDTLTADLLNSMRSIRLLGLRGNQFVVDSLPTLNLPELRVLDIENVGFTGPFPSLAGVPQLRNSSFFGLSMSGASHRFHNYSVSLESRFCGGNAFTTVPDFTGADRLDEEDLDLSCFATTATYHRPGLGTVSIFPNPATDVIRVRGDGRPNLQVELFTLLGKQLLTAGRRDEIEVASLPNGTYLLRVFDPVSQESLTERVIVAH